MGNMENMANITGILKSKKTGEKKMVKKGLLAILILATMGVTALFCFVYITEDRQGPVITVPDESIIYKNGDSEEKLLEGVTAKDKREGDVR